MRPLGLLQFADVILLRADSATHLYRVFAFNPGHVVVDYLRC